MEDAPDIILTDYIGKATWQIATLDNDTSRYFKLAGVDFRDNVNIITDLDPPSPDCFCILS